MKDLDVTLLGRAPWVSRKWKLQENWESEWREERASNFWRGKEELANKSKEERIKEKKGWRKIRGKRKIGNEINIGIY